MPVRTRRRTAFTNCTFVVTQDRITERRQNLSEPDLALGRMLQGRMLGNDLSVEARGTRSLGFTLNVQDRTTARLHKPKSLRSEP